MTESQNSMTFGHLFMFHEFSMAFPVSVGTLVAHNLAPVQTPTLH